jgi:hypothetical protein
MVGVDHTIDSSGWFTTIKGQIRSTSEEQPEETKTFMQKAADMRDEAERQAKAHVAAEEFIKYQKKRLDDIAYERAEALANALLGDNYQKYVERYTGKIPKKNFPDRPVDKAAEKLMRAMKGGGTWEGDVYSALKTTRGYAVCQDALKAAFRRRAEVQGYTGKNLNLDHWLDWDFDNDGHMDDYTHVAILAGYRHRSYEGRGWGDGGNKDNAPPKAGPWIGNLRNAAKGADGNTKYIKNGKGKPNGSYWINH